MRKVLVQAIKQAPSPERARQGFTQLAGTSAASELEKAASEQARILAALFSGSQAMGGLLLAHPGWLGAVLNPEHLEHPRQEQGLRREVNAWLGPALQNRDNAGAFAKLRLFKQKEMLRIAARDLARLGAAPEITREISNVADVCLGAVLQLCRQPLVERFGQPYHQDAEERWHSTEFAVIGLGKLGGQELNYSSDVDVIFVYDEEGTVFKDAPGPVKVASQVMSSHQFFKRLAEAFIAEVTRQSSEGFLFRIDLRLRPEGDAGPLVRSTAGYENYYAQWGQTWERMMLIKARFVGGDAALAADFIEMVQPFRYPRSLSEGFLNEVAAMRARIENEVLKAGEIERNVKLGRGGIREIEFVAQALQLLHAGRLPFLQGPQTLPTLEKLKEYNLLAADEAKALSAAYCFLRDIEHRLQMENNLQTHTIPTDSKARERLAALMGFGRLAGFESALRDRTTSVRRAYDKLLNGESSPPTDSFPRQFQGAENEWKAVLAGHSFKDVEKSFRLVREFASGPGYVHVSSRTADLAWQLLPKLFALCPRLEGDGPRLSEPQRSGTEMRLPREGTTRAHRTRCGSESRGPTLRSARSPARLDGEGRITNLTSSSKILSDPDRVMARLDSFISAYGSRAMLFETWASNPSLFELLLLLFDRSEFLAEIAIRAPDLVDDLVLSGRLRRRKTTEEILSELRHGRSDKDQRLWLRRYHQAELLRIGLRDILGLADYEQNLAELTHLAEACLQYALEAVCRKHKLTKSPLVVIGLGKLGGEEINYGSDLDIIFVAGLQAKGLPRLQRLAAEFIELLSSPTELGTAFVLDARLRPDGEKGLLVNTLPAYEDYYRRRAQLWEIQSLTRTRSIAGDFELGKRFQGMTAALTDFRPKNVVAGFGVSRSGAGAACSQERGRPCPRGGRSKGHADEGVRAPGELGRAEPTLARDDVQSVLSTDSGEATGLAAYGPDWQKRIAQMRHRIEKERTPAGQDALAIKTGSGGLMDAEFIAQTLCLANGWQEANTLRALERTRDTEPITPADAARLVENYRQLRRVEGILRRWSFEGETVLPLDAAPFYRVSVRCGYATPEAFREAVAGYRRAIRTVYEKFFDGLNWGPATSGNGRE